VRVWISDARQRRTIADHITDKLKREFDRAGIEIPYAKRDLYIRAMPSDAPALLPATTATPAISAPPATGADSMPSPTGADSAPPATETPGERHE